MNKFSLAIHILAQILAQGAVIALVPSGLPMNIFMAIVAIIGVLVAFFDTSHAQNLMAAGKGI